MPRSAWLAAGAAAAALLLPTLGPRSTPPLVVGLVAIAAAGSLVRGHGRWVVAGPAVGALLIAIRLLALPGTPVATLPPNGEGPWSMVVETVGSPRDGDQVATLRSLEAVGGSILRLAATLPRYPEVRPGDRLEVRGRVRPRPEGGYGDFLERIGAAGTLDVDRSVVVGTDPGAMAVLEGLRRAAADALTTVLPEPEAGLAAGIIIGLRDRVDREVAAAFTTAGVSHVVAISGWNIAIVAATVAALAGRLGRRRRTVVTIVAIATYIAFAGASPSVLRAGLMAGVVLVARETGRSSRAAAALGWAAVGLLVADPGLIGDAGFQLSTLATAGLIAWGTGTTERISRWTGGRAPEWLAESLGVSLAAQLATLPIVVAAFGRLALVAPAINIVVVPLVAPVMAAGVLAMIAGMLVGLGLPAGIGAAIALPAWVGLRLMIALVDIAAGLPFASLEVPAPWSLVMALGATAIIAAVVVWPRRSRLPRRATAASTASVARVAAGAAGAAGRAGRPTSPRVQRVAVLCLVVAIACVGAVAASRPAGVARLTVLDVGQGDAILIEGSRGGRLLVDGGPDPDRLLVELDRRLPPWDRRIDVVIMSHPHEDHVAGLVLLLARYNVARVLDAGMRGPGPSYAALLASLQDVDAPIHDSIAAGDRLAVDDIALEVRWPIRGSVPLEAPEGGAEINNFSIVLLGTVGDRRFLLTGDIEEEVDPSLLAVGLPAVDILKVAHHGSRTATTEAFLAAIRPRVAIASVGRGNLYGHPTRATTDRLAAIGARVYRTDVDGTVSVAFEPGGPVVRRSPRRRAVTGEAVTGVATPRPPPPPDQWVGQQALAAAAPSVDDAARSLPLQGLRYHRVDGRSDVARIHVAAAVAVGERPGRGAAAVRVGRRRPPRRPARRSLRHRAGEPARHAARALGRPP